MVLSLPLRQRCRPIDCAASSVSRTNYVAAIGGERLCHRYQSSRIFNCFGKKKKTLYWKTLVINAHIQVLQIDIY